MGHDDLADHDRQERAAAKLRRRMEWYRRLQESLKECYKYSGADESVDEMVWQRILEAKIMVDLVLAHDK